jgi:hypothetical protein
MNANIRCFKCAAVLADINSYSLHLRHVHSFSLCGRLGNERLQCAQDGCQRTFSIFSGLKRHIRLIHFAPNYAEVQPPEHLHNDGQHGNQRNFHPPDNALENDDNVPQDNHAAIAQVFNLKKSATQMICNLRSCPSMTGALVSSVIDGCESLISDITSHLKTEVVALLENLQLDVNSVPVQNLIDQFNVAPFDQLRSTSNQLDQFKNNLNYIEPEVINLGTRIDNVFNRSTMVYEPKVVQESIQYVSIISVLRLVLSNEDVKEAILNEPSSNDGFAKSFVDGNQFKNNPFLQAHPRAIRLQIYYDDIEITNPIGTKTGSHKIGAFYFTIQNLSYRRVSSLSNVHMFLLCHTADVTKYGFHRILERFMEDISKLESEAGINIQLINGQDFLLRGILNTLCADGLAAHQLLELLSPACRHFCRLCMVKREDLHNYQGHVVHQRRTRELFDEQVALVAENPAMSLQTGLNRDGRNSALHAANYFHASQNMVFDLMHDLLEGICQMELKFVLRKYICEDRIFSVQLFNRRVKSFIYGFPEHRNKPSANFNTASLNNISEHKVKQKAMQTWCLMRTFPFLVADKVADDDPHLELILLLLQIMEIVFAPKISPGQVEYLRLLITDHHLMMRKLFPGINLINKHHHVEHYPECIEESGPLGLYWCMRFEAKHQGLKRHAASCYNFINSPLTLARMNQVSQCAMWGAQNDWAEKVKCTRGTTIAVSSCLDPAHLTALGYANDALVFQTPSAFVCGVEVRKGLFVMNDDGHASNQSLPHFGTIQQILILNNGIGGQEAWLTIEKWKTVYFEEKLNSYLVRHIPERPIITINCSNLPYHLPIAPWNDYRSEKKYLSLRHVV